MASAHNGMAHTLVPLATQVAIGAAAPSITAFARSSADNLVVLASHMRVGWRRVLVGSVARRIAQTVPTPVVVCPVGASEAQTADPRFPEHATAVAG